jgi:hypothetical protein
MSLKRICPLKIGWDLSSDPFKAAGRPRKLLEGFGWDTYIIYCHVQLPRA